MLNQQEEANKDLPPPLPRPSGLLALYSTTPVRADQSNDMLLSVTSRFHQSPYSYHVKNTGLCLLDHSINQNVIEYKRKMKQYHGEKRAQEGAKLKVITSFCAKNGLKSGDIFFSLPCDPDATQQSATIPKDQFNVTNVFEEEDDDDEDNDEEAQIEKKPEIGKKRRGSPSLMPDAKRSRVDRNNAKQSKHPIYSDCEEYESCDVIICNTENAFAQLSKDSYNDGTTSQFSKKKILKGAKLINMTVVTFQEMLTSLNVAIDVENGVDGASRNTSWRNLYWNFFVDFGWRFSRIC
ncbi:hypothetical protein V5799_022758 [Amblyomma americanum]|uniref:Uncharacterized protein n=1 Tax=Amblyomma americanum TaxID=6943 RepID=A0AAQ4FLL4_AMBAM